MKNKTETILLEAREKYYEGCYRQSEILIESGKIKKITVRTIDHNETYEYDPKDKEDYTPEKEPFEFRRQLYNMIHTWEKNNIKEKEKFFMYVSQEERKKYFGKYSEPVVFQVSERKKGWYPRNYFVYILDGKVFSVTELVWRNPSFPAKKILTGDDIPEYLVESIKLLIYENGMEEYKRFLNCLCKEELEKYFAPSYLPKQPSQLFRKKSVLKSEYVMTEE